MEIWNIIIKLYFNLDDVLFFNNFVLDYILSYTDKIYFSEEMDNYVLRVRGYFILSYFGNYSFMIKVDDGVSFYLSNSENFNDKVKYSCIFFNLIFEKMKEYIINLFFESLFIYCNTYVVRFLKIV